MIPIGDLITYRYESFGGILHLRRPSALVFVDKDYMLSLGYAPSPLWDMRTRILSAPTEVHLAVTGHCSRNCDDCYMDAGDRSDRIEDGVVRGELGPEGLMAAVDELARMRVFHVALGGGESFEMPWLMDVVRHIRGKGIVPNITTNGHFIGEHNVFQCANFGQINLSLSALPDERSHPEARRHFQAVDHALDLLRRAGIRAGINCVVTRNNFDRLEEIVRYAARKHVREVEFLRFKPSGRARAVYRDRALAPEQAKAFFPRVRELMQRYRVTLKLDCSFTPLICCHGPDRDRMEFFSILGCEGGNVLIGAFPDGRVAPCSFASPAGIDLRELSRHWNRPETFAEYRGWKRLAPEPCVSCAYLSLCRGGCHVVSQFYTGDPQAADPECPVVHEQMPVIH